MNGLKEKLQSGAKLCGAHVTLTDPCICEMIGYLGYDYIWIDLEHTYISYKDLHAHLSAAKAGGTPAIVRVPQHDLTVTKKVLEMGPDGIVFPMIHDPDEAAEFLSWTLYPPYGVRGFGPARAIRYGLDDAAEYIKNTRDTLCRFIQIELKCAFDCLDELVKNPYVDGFIVGPCDLSGSVGEQGNMFGEKTIATIKETIAALHAAGKRVGLSVGASDEKTLRFWNGLDFDFISTGSDAGYIFGGAKDTLLRIRAIQAGK